VVQSEMFIRSLTKNITGGKKSRVTYVNNQEVKGQWFTQLGRWSSASVLHGKARDI